MQVTVKPVTRVVALSVDDRDLGEFRLVSEWEGLMKLQDADRNVVILSSSDGALARVFSEIFGRADGERWEVVKLSPPLISTFVGSEEAAK